MANAIIGDWMQNKWEVEDPSMGPCPVSFVRDAETGEWVGEVWAFRWPFWDVRDPERREEMNEENLNRGPGEPEIVWTLACEFVLVSGKGRNLISIH